MQLLEFQAKQMLNLAGLPIPLGVVTSTGEGLPEVALPVVVKSQVPVGGRGKLGGVKLVRDQQGLEEAIATISSREIKGHTPECLLVEEALDIENELYISLQVNRDEREVTWMASGEGGMDIETHADDIMVIPQKDKNAHRLLAETLGVEKTQLTPILQNLEKCFFDNDLLLLEINPLVITSSGEIICADAKVTVDDNARFRQSSFTWPAYEHVKPLGGTIGVIANGAGMAMSTMDAIYTSGGHPANFLDIGGGTGEAVFINNLREINSLTGLTSIIVNIFAGITRCDEIARGIIAAKKQIPHLAPLFIRLEGTRRDEAAVLLEKAGVALQPDLKTCIALALESEIGRSEGREMERKQQESEPSTAHLPEEAVAASASRTPQGSFPLGASKANAPPVESALTGGVEQETYNALFTNAPVIVQGITGHHGTFHTRGMLDAGTHVVAGVTPGKGGQNIHGIPVYNSVKEAVSVHSATTSVVFVPAPFAKSAAFEAIDAGVKLVVIITEGIPVHDMLAIHEKASCNNVAVVGPNCPGLIVPSSHKLGIIAAHITAPGHTTVISRSGTLTYELSDALTKKGVGQRLILGIGGDPVQGMTFVGALEIAQNDPETDQIVIVGEIGGEGENIAADYVRNHVTKPVYGLIVGHSLPPGQTFGHAGAIVGHHDETAAAKTAYMTENGVHMFTTLDELISAL